MTLIMTGVRDRSLIERGLVCVVPNQSKAVIMSGTSEFFRRVLLIEGPHKGCDGYVLPSDWILPK